MSQLLELQPVLHCNNKVVRSWCLEHKNTLSFIRLAIVSTYRNHLLSIYQSIYLPLSFFVNLYLSHCLSLFVTLSLSLSLIVDVRDLSPKQILMQASTQINSQLQSHYPLQSLLCSRFLPMLSSLMRIRSLADLGSLDSQPVSSMSLS